MTQPVMRPSTELTHVYLYRDPVDFRKSFKGLAVLVEQELGHNPFDGYLYAFTNRQTITLPNGLRVSGIDHSNLTLASQLIEQLK